MRALLVIALLAACVDPHDVPCGSHVCAATDVCTPSGCAARADVAACNGVADGSACTSSTQATGTCIDGVCRTSTCGNGLVEPGEACDGNAGLGAGETCSSDCKRIQVCGNGVVDPGEACDDGNQNPADGCAATCTGTAWTASVLFGDDGSLSTAVGGPRGVVALPDGSFYVSDPGHSRVLRIDVSGAVTLVAGNGTEGFSGDNGPATAAELDHPAGLAIDNLGSLYIADAFNLRVRRVSNGIITTVAGTGSGIGGGIGGPAVAANISDAEQLVVDGLGQLYIASTTDAVVYRVDTNGNLNVFAGQVRTYGNTGDGGPATSALLEAPAQLALDPAGTLYIADSSPVIRAVDAAGIIHTVAGKVGVFSSTGDGGPATNATFNSPTGIAVDGHGGYYVVDGNAHNLRHINASGTITTIAGSGLEFPSGDGGPAAQAALGDPTTVTVDGVGNIIFADPGFSLVRRIDTSNVINTVAGTLAAKDDLDGALATSRGVTLVSIALDTQDQLYGSTIDNRVIKIDSSGVIHVVAGTGIAGYSGDGGPATQATFQLNRIAIDAQNRVLVADAGNHRIRRIDTAGIVTTIAGTGTAGSTGDGGPATSAQLNTPRAVALDAAGNIYIADTNNNLVRKIDSTGVITTVAGTGMSGYSGDGGLATRARLNLPTGLAFDAAGQLYIGDVGNSRIRRVDTAGNISTFAGNGTQGSSGDGVAATSVQLTIPGNFTFDGAGEMWLIDNDFNGLRRVDTAGIIHTVKRPARPAPPDGDGGPFATCAISSPAYIAYSPARGLFVGDGDRIRQIDTTSTVFTPLGPLDPDGTGARARAHLVDARGLVCTADATYIASGATGVLERLDANQLTAVAGRYPQPTAAPSLARIRNASFGDVRGVAYDDATRTLYITAGGIFAIDASNPDRSAWTITALGSTTAGARDGSLATAQYREPAGLYLDAASHTLYVADAGNHAVRAIDLAAQTVQTVAGTLGKRGFAGDTGPAASALLFSPVAVTRCPNGDLFIAEAGNHRVRRVHAGTIDTVLGDGTPASSGEGSPATLFPIDTPAGITCDARGNVFATSRTSIRALFADDAGVVDGTGAVQTIYGRSPRSSYPESVTDCLTGIVSVDATTVRFTDSCAGLYIQLALGGVP